MLLFLKRPRRRRGVHLPAFPHTPTRKSRLSINPRFSPASLPLKFISSSSTLTAPLYPASFNMLSNFPHGATPWPGMVYRQKFPPKGYGLDNADCCNVPNSYVFSSEISVSFAWTCHTWPTNSPRNRTGSIPIRIRWDGSKLIARQSAAVSLKNSRKLAGVQHSAGYQGWLPG